MAKRMLGAFGGGRFVLDFKVLLIKFYQINSCG